VEDIENIIESLLFVAETPLSLDQLKITLPEAEPEKIREAVLSLKLAYETKNGGFFIHEVAGGYQFRTRPEHKEWIRRLLQPKPPRLSKPAMETLAIIAYRQPVLRTEVEQIRGVNSGNSIRLLLERGLIRVLGRREIPGRPLVYATTPKFLETFDLKDLKDLPSLKEIDELQSRLAKPRQQEIVFGDTQSPGTRPGPDTPDALDDEEGFPYDQEDEIDDEMGDN
jgi:segregation and condensation protein B